MSGERVHLSLDEQTANVLEELESHIEENYGGKSGFFRTMVKEYSEDEAVEAQVKAIKRKIRKKESELEFLEKELETWQRQLKEEKKEQKKESKNEELENLKSRRSELSSNIRDEEQIRKEINQLYEDNDRHDTEDPKVQEAIEDRIERELRKKQEKREELEEVREQIRDLEQEEIEVDN